MANFLIALIALLHTSFCLAKAQSFSNFDLTDLKARYAVSGARASVTGQTCLRFQMRKSGQFFFHFNGLISKAFLDGSQIPLSALTRQIFDGSRSASYLLRQQFASGDEHTLKLHYRVDPSQFRVQRVERNSVVTFGTRYENAAGVGPEAIMPSLNRPASHPRFLVEIVFASSEEAKLYKPI